MLMCRKNNSLQIYHSSVVTLTFASFVLNDPQLYAKTQHMSLMIGFISIAYLSSIFVSSNWKWTLLGNTLSTWIVGHYYTKYFGYNIQQITPALILHILSCTCVSFYVEMKQKQNFLETKVSEGL